MLTRCKNTQSSSVARKLVEKISSPKNARFARESQGVESSRRLSSIQSYSTTAHLGHLKQKAPLYCTHLTQKTTAQRYISTEASSSNVETPSSSQAPPINPNTQSLFDTNRSAWDEVFQGLENLPPLQPESVRSPLRASMAPLDSSIRHTRRQAMTAREISAFDDMFNMIFNAVSKSKGNKLGENLKDRKADPLTNAGIGRSPEGQMSMNDLYGKLRRHSKRVRWTVEEDEELDRKKVEIDSCQTDHELLQWAMKEVFEDSQKREEEARKAVLDASASLKKSKSKTSETPTTPTTIPMLQSPSYSHLITHLILTFRERFHDPNLALAIFEHARRLSIASYVCGCSTSAYNELIETRWKCFRDFKGVHDALEEMKVNGVDPDGRTKVLVESVRRELSARNFWQEVSASEIDTGEVANMMMKMEAFVAKSSEEDVDEDSERPANKEFTSITEKKFGHLKQWSWRSERWKLDGIKGDSESDANADVDDNWEFGRWDDLEEQDRKSRSKALGKPLNKIQKKFPLPPESKMVFHGHQRRPSAPKTVLH